MAAHPTPPRPAPHLPTRHETSAGGFVVAHDQRHVALIARHNAAGVLDWLLPKGHIEAGETLEQTAVREVFEETGITARIVAPLGTLDYWFTTATHRIHKTVHHYLMHALTDTITGSNDPDEEIFEAAWVDLAEVENTLTFANERAVAAQALDALDSSLPDKVGAPHTSTETATDPGAGTNIDTGAATGTGAGPGTGTSVGAGPGTGTARTPLNEPQS